MSIKGQKEFTIRDNSEIETQIESYYPQIGYSLVEKQANKWVYKRGKKSSTLLRFDIRAYPTILTIQTIRHPPDDLTILSNWDVSTLLGIPTKGDYERLEEEAQNFENLLTGKPLIVKQPEKSYLWEAIGVSALGGALAGVVAHDLAGGKLTLLIFLVSYIMILGGLKGWGKLVGLIVYTIVAAFMVSFLGFLSTH